MPANKHSSSANIIIRTELIAAKCYEPGYVLDLKRQLKKLWLLQQK